MWYGYVDSGDGSLLRKRAERESIHTVSRHIAGVEDSRLAARAQFSLLFMTVFRPHRLLGSVFSNWLILSGSVRYILFQHEWLRPLAAATSPETIKVLYFVDMCSGRHMAHLIQKYAADASLPAAVREALTELVSMREREESEHSLLQEKEMLLKEKERMLVRKAALLSESQRLLKIKELVLRMKSAEAN